MKLTKEQKDLLPSALRCAIASYNADAAKVIKKGRMMEANVIHRDCTLLHEMANLIENAREVEVR